MVRRLSPREKKIFVACVIMIFAYFGYHALIRPLKERIAVIDGKIESQQRKITAHLRIIKKAEAMEKTYAEIISRYKQDKSNDQVMTAIFTEVEQAAGELGLRISDLKPQRVKKGDNYNRFSVSLTINSEFIEIMEFLHKLQEEPHSFYVDEARFDKSGKRDSTELKTRLVLSKVLIP